MRVNFVAKTFLQDAVDAADIASKKWLLQLWGENPGYSPHVFFGRCKVPLKICTLMKLTYLTKRLSLFPVLRTWEQHCSLDINTLVPQEAPQTSVQAKMAPSRTTTRATKGIETKVHSFLRIYHSWFQPPAQEFLLTRHATSALLCWCLIILTLPPSIWWPLYSLHPQLEGNNRQVGARNYSLRLYNWVYLLPTNLLLSPWAHEAILHEANLLQQGAIERAPPHHQGKGFYCPVFLVPKKDRE